MHQESGSPRKPAVKREHGLGRELFTLLLQLSALTYASVNIEGPTPLAVAHLMQRRKEDNGSCAPGKQNF